MLDRHQPRHRCYSAQRNSKRILTVVLCGIAAGGFAQSQSVGTKSPVGTGSIQGVVTDPSGNSVVGVKIWAIRTFSPTPTAAPIAITADTDAKGAYLFPSLVPASYRICVSAEGAGLLDPCSWSANPPLRNLQSGQAANLDIELVRGAFVHVRVDDPSGAIAKQEQVSNGTALNVSGSADSGQRVNFMEVVKDATGRTFRALVPVGNTVQVKIGTPLSVVDGLGKSINSIANPGTTAPVTISSKAVEQVVKLTVH